MKMQNIKESDSHYRDIFTLDKFLLVHDYAQEAFINLSKTKETICRNELLEETKRLIIGHLLEQIRENRDKLIKKE